MNFQTDHLRLVCSIPPKISLSEYMGIIKGKTAIKLFEKKRYLKEKPSWENYFWARGNFVSKLGIDVELLKRYEMYQEKGENKTENERKDATLL